MREALRLQIETARLRHAQDPETGFGEVRLPHVLSRKYPNAPRLTAWQYVFPASRRSADPRDGRERRHHLDEKTLQRAVSAAGRAAGLEKAVSPHRLRHCFATHLLECGSAIRTVQELLGHEDVATAKICTHVPDRGTGAALGSLDRLRRGEKNAGGVPPAFGVASRCRTDQFRMQVPGLAEVNSALVAHSGWSMNGLRLPWKL